MWHEARKQERRIRGLIVDYRKRAERRQDFYEKIQADPTQFIQVHGRRCKIHLDASVAAAGDGAAIIVPWQGQQDNLIDRFDVRAHLDYIPPVIKSVTESGEEADITQEERQLNYERYRILAQNDFLNVTEEKFLHQLFLEEQFGANAQLEAERNLGKKKQKGTGATIGYSYDDVSDTASGGAQPFSHLMGAHASTVVPSAEKEGSDESDSDMDMDVSIDIIKLDTAQAHELNACGRNYGMKSNDFYSYLTKDADEADALRIAREEEQEKMLLSGRKSRRERRAQKERRIANRPFSPPSYAAKEEGKKDNEEESESRSPSPAEAGTEKITYITSFGGEDELQPHSKITINLNKPGHTLGESCISASGILPSGQVSYAQKVKDNLEKLKHMNESAKRTARKTDRHSSRSRSRSHSVSHSRRRSRRRSYYRRSRSRSWRRRRHSRSTSNERRRHRRSRSRSNSRKRYSSTASSGSSRASSHGRRGRSRSVSCYRDTRHRGTKGGSPKRRQSPLHTMERKPQIIATVPATSSVVPAKLAFNISQPPPPQQPEMISYPLPTRIMSLTTPTAAIATTAPSTSSVGSTIPQVIEPPPPPLKRYYGRKRGDDTSSSSESSAASDAEEKSRSVRGRDQDDSDGNIDVDTTSDRSNPLPSTSSSTTGNQTGKYSSATEIKSGMQGSSTASSGGGRLNLRERLKRKMQNLLNRQYKADKRAEIEKTERERQMQQEREDQMRELALKLRRRQRELRHKYGTPSSGKDTGSDGDGASESAGTKRFRRSISRSVERVASMQTPRHSRRSGSYERRHSRVRRSVSRDRRRSRSRRRTNSRERRRRSRSRRSISRERRRSRSRRSQSRRRRRSKSQVTRRRERDRSGARDREREHTRQREARETRHVDRDRDRTRQPPDSSSSGNRGRVVISAPPKLKKLVDY